MDKPVVKIICSEDYTEMTTKGGEFICRVERDEDSHSAAETVLSALNFEIVYE